MARGINVIGSAHVSIHNNEVRDCMTGGIGINETYGIIECGDIDIYNNNIFDTIGGTTFIIESSDYASYTYDVNIWGNYIDAYRQVKLDAGGVAVDNGDGTVTLPATDNGFKAGLVITIKWTMNYNGNYTLKSGTDDNHIIIGCRYAAEQFDGTETVSALSIGAFFDSVTGFNFNNNVIETGQFTYWCYVTSAAYNGLVENNLRTAGISYVNHRASTTFINNNVIVP